MTVQIFTGLGTGATVAMGSIIAADLAGEFWAGAASTGNTLGAAVAAIPLARIALARGRRWALAGGVAVGILGAILVITADTLRIFPLLLLGFVCLGFAAAVSLQARFAATDLALPRNRGRDLSLVVWSTTIGGIVGPNLFQPGAELAGLVGLPPNSGPFLVVIATKLAAITMVLIALRPDPLLTARRFDAEQQRNGKNSADARAARFGRHRGVTLAFVIAFMGLSHGVMVAVMAMTPVHLAGHGATLTVVGFVISLHVGGMYALSPVFGWLSDRVGRLWIMAVGAVLLVASLVVAASGSLSQAAVTVALTLLGLGWSASTVAGAALLTDLASGAHRVRIQGRSDMTMNLSGATAGALAGPVLAVVGYSGLAVASCTLVLGMVVIVLVLRVRLRTESAAEAGPEANPEVGGTSVDDPSGV